MNAFEAMAACDGCGKQTRVRDFAIDSTGSKVRRLCPTCWKTLITGLHKTHPNFINVDLNSGTFTRGKSKKRYNL